MAPSQPLGGARSFRLRRPTSPHSLSKCYGVSPKWANTTLKAGGESMGMWRATILFSWWWTRGPVQPGCLRAIRAIAVRTRVKSGLPRRSQSGARDAAPGARPAERGLGQGHPFLNRLVPCSETRGGGTPQKPSPFGEDLCPMREPGGAESHHSHGSVAGFGMPPRGSRRPRPCPPSSPWRGSLWS